MDEALPKRPGTAAGRAIPRETILCAGADKRQAGVFDLPCRLSALRGLYPLLPRQASGLPRSPYSYLPVVSSSLHGLLFTSLSALRASAPLVFLPVGPSGLYASCLAWVRAEASNAGMRVAGFFILNATYRSQNGAGIHPSSSGNQRRIPIFVDNVTNWSATQKQSLTLH